MTPSTRIDRAATWLLGALLLLLPWIHSSVLADPFMLPKKIATLTVALLLCGLAILSRLTGARRPSFVSPALLLALATLACAAIAVLPAVNRAVAIQGLADLAAGLVLFWGVTRFVRDTAGAALMLRSIALSAGLVALSMVLQVFVPGLNFSMGGMSILPPTKAGAALGDPGLAAQFLILALPIGVGAAGMTLGAARLLWGACIGLVLSGLAFAGRPEGWLVGGVTGGLILVTRVLQVARGDRIWGRLLPDPVGDSLRAALVALILVVATFALARWPAILPTASPAAPIDGVTLLSPTTGDPATDRKAAIRGTFALLGMHPVGVGPDGWRHAFLQVAWTRTGKSPFTLNHQAMHAGNDFLERASEFGLLGGIAYVLLFAVLIAQAWVAATRAPGGWGTCGYATLNLLLALGASAFYGAPFEEPVPSALFWIAAGLTQIALLQAGELPGRLAWLRPALGATGGTNSSVAEAASGGQAAASVREASRSGRPFFRERQAPWAAAIVWIALVALLGRLTWTRVEASWLTLQGQAALYAGKAPAALRALTQEAARDSPDFIPHVLAADAYLRLGRTDRAELEFGEALERSPWFLAAHLGRASAYQAAGRYDLADQDLRSALLIWPDNTDTLMALARLNAVRGKIDEALEGYQTIAKMNETLADPYCRMGEIYLKRAQADEAIEAFRLCGSKNPRFPGVQMRMGDAFFAKGLADMALRAYEAAALTDEKNVEIRIKIANTNMALAKPCDAKEALQAARTLETDVEKRKQILELIKKVEPDCSRQQKKKPGAKG